MLGIIAYLPSSVTHRRNTGPCRNILLSISAIIEEEENIPVLNIIVPPPQDLDEIRAMFAQLIQLSHENAVTAQAAQAAQAAAQAAQAAQPAQPAQNKGSRTATLTTIPIFTGSAHSPDLADWILSIDRAALADGWDDPMRRRVAIGKLGGHALGWHYSTGIDLAT